MANPRSLTYALYQHWDVVENLVKEYDAVDAETVEMA